MQTQNNEECLITFEFKNSDDPSLLMPVFAYVKEWTDEEMKGGSIDVELRGIKYLVIKKRPCFLKLSHEARLSEVSKFLTDMVADMLTDMPK
jgi:hypothetical protein